MKDMFWWTHSSRFPVEITPSQFAASSLRRAFALSALFHFHDVSCEHDDYMEAREMLITSPATATQWNIEADLLVYFVFNIKKATTLGVVRASLGLVDV